METTYYFRVHIESAGTEYENEDGSISKSKTGHVWYEIYEKDSSGNIVEDSVKNAGYTKDGVVTNDGKAYLGDPSFSTSELELTKEQFETLEDFGKENSPLAAEHGFGDGHILNGGDYNPANNSCIDYTWKAMELAGINRGDFEGTIWPMANKEYLEIVVNDGLALNKYLAHFYDDESFRGEMKDMLAHAHLLGLGYTPSNSQIIQRVDPLILDLNGDGVVETTSKGSVYFDHDANGFAEQTGWVGADDGLLIYDRNNNGKIDDGTELFGNNTLLSNGNKATNGFEALKEFDTNKDGVIDKSDEIYSQLKVWQDANQNGVVDEGELKTLEELGIESLNTSYVNSSLVDENNNAHKQLGSFTKDGQTYKMNDVWFDVDLARTKELNLVEVSEEIQRLALVS